MKVRNDYIQENLIRPTYLSKIAKSDDCRLEFDCKNQCLLEKKLPIDLLLIGDSITQMWETSAYFFGSGICVVNRGAGGDRTEYLLHRFMADVIQLNPKLCVIQIGINDTWQLEKDFFRPVRTQSYKEILKKAIGNINKICKISCSYQQKIAICSILPTNMFWTLHERERHLFIKEFNINIKELCKNNCIDFINYYDSFLSADGESLNMDLSIEGLHPNAFGYEIMYNILYNYLSSKSIINYSK